jgi:hypothetical protein
MTQTGALTAVENTNPRELRLLRLSIAASVMLTVAFVALVRVERPLLVLRGALLLVAAFELGNGLPPLLAARRFIAANGWPDHRVYHAVVQDAGVYNLGMAAAFGLAALDPARNVAIVQAGIFLFFLHAAAHLLRWVGTRIGREPFFPPRLELAAGLPLLAMGLGLALFYPS